MEPRKGDYIQTYTGQRFYVLDPRADEVKLDDIARGLAHQTRFGGQTKSFYSVAQHSIYTSRLVSPRAKLWALFHDATEAYICDVPRPLKYMMPTYIEAEKKVEHVIIEALGIEVDDAIRNEVKQADNAMLFYEARTLLSHPELVEEWMVREGFEKPPGTLHSHFAGYGPWAPHVAYHAFHTTYNRLLIEARAA